MTTFQEPQPQSRRAVRQSERSDETPSAFPSASGQPPFTPTTPLAPGQVDARDMWDTTARRAAQLSAPPTAPPGRRAASRPATPGAEPLLYSTQQRPLAPEPAPAPAQPQFRARGNAPARPVADAALSAPVSAPDQPSYRPRDFSPGGGGRRAAAPTESAPSAPAREAAPVASAPPGWTQPIEPSDLNYHTEARHPFAAAAAPVADLAPAAAPFSFAEETETSGPSEHTMSRRELRALREQTEGVANPPQLVEPPPLVEPGVVAPDASSARLPAVAPEPDVNTGLTSALAEFDLLASGQSLPAPGPTPPAPPAARVEAPVQPSAPPAAPSLIDSIPPSIAPAAPMPEPAPVTPATGHWAAQLDEDEIFETTVSRTVGSTPSTTNALVLPSAPVGSDIRGALTGTGEIMLTGSIDLPANFAATGASSALENNGIDALFDSQDAEIITTDSAPVRAIKAVSTHNSGQGVTHTQKPKGTRALTALVIAASSMAVVVAGLLVAAIAMNLF